MASKRNGRGTERMLVTIDVTDIYDAIAKKAKDEVRTVEEQCRYLVKKGICGPDTVSYVSWNTSPGPTYNISLDHSVDNPYKDKGPYCGAGSAAADGNPV